MQLLIDITMHRIVDQNMIRLNPTSGDRKYHMKIKLSGISIE